MSPAANAAVHVGATYAVLGLLLWLAVKSIHGEESMITAAVPNRATDAGPQDPRDPRSTWDVRDWLYEAGQLVKHADVLRRDDPKIQRRLRLDAIDEAMDALKMARELVEVE